MSIDTSTTTGKIKVQQAWFDRKNVQYKLRIGERWKDLHPNTEPVWDWGTIDYKLVPQTVEEAAEEFNKSSPSVSGLNSNEWVKQYFIAGAEWQKEQDNE